MARAVAKANLPIHELAANIADKTIANAIKNGTGEHHDSVTGKALGVSDYSMSSTLAAMMLDGLSCQTAWCSAAGIDLLHEHGSR